MSQYNYQFIEKIRDRGTRYSIPHIFKQNSNLRNSIGPKPGFFYNNKISKKLGERERGEGRGQREREVWNGRKSAD